MHQSEERRLPAHYSNSEHYMKRAGEGHVGGGAASSPNMTWELPAEEKVPSAKGCEKCHRCSNCGQFHEEAFAESILLAPMVVAKIRGLMHHFSEENKNEREWLAYLVADEDGVFTDIFVPKQVGFKATVHVDRDALRGDEKIDGVIHSHNSMMAFHSGTDDEHLINNHPVSIVVAMKKGVLDWDGVRNVMLSCGARYTAKKVPVLMNTPECDEWVQEAQKLVEHGTYTSSHNSQSYGYSPGKVWDKEKKTYVDAPPRGSVVVAPGITEVKPTTPVPMANDWADGY